MEVMIQFRNRTWSFGAKGFRRLTTWDWNAMEEGFKRAYEAQTLADHAERTRYADGHEALGKLSWTNESNWRGDRDLHKLPDNKDGEGTSTYKVEC